MQVALLRNIVNRRPFLNVYIIERLALSHIFYFNRYNSCLSPCIFVVFIIFVIYNPHGAGVDGLQHRVRYAGKVDRFAHGEAPLFLDSAGIGHRLENANPCRVKMPPSRQPLYYTKEESLWLYCSRAVPPCQAARGRMETYSAEKVVFWRFLRHIGYNSLTAKAENTPARDSTPELLMDQIKITTKGARRNCRHLFLYGLVSGHALRYNQKQDRLLRMDSMNRTTDDLLDALLSKQDLPEYFEENDAELLQQTPACRGSAAATRCIF